MISPSWSQFSSPQRLAGNMTWLSGAGKIFLGEITINGKHNAARKNHLFSAGKMKKYPGLW
jgi:hypothetical protein